MKFISIRGHGYCKVTAYQIFITFFSVTFSVYLDYKRIWQFGSSGILLDTNNELLQNILLLKVAKTDIYSINGEINSKIALKRGSFKYDVLEAIIASRIYSLLYQTWGFYISYIYLCIYKIYIIYEILYMLYMRYIIYIYTWYGVDDTGIQDILYTYI